MQQRWFPACCGPVDALPLAVHIRSCYCCHCWCPSVCEPAAAATQPHSMLQPLRLRAAQQQILTLAVQLGQQVEAPRIVCQAVSLTSALGLPFGSSFAPPSWRHAASKADAGRADAARAEPGRSEPGPAEAPMATHVVHERQGERPPDIISRALAKGPPELPFPAKAFYLGGPLQAHLKHHEVAPVSATSVAQMRTWPRCGGHQVCERMVQAAKLTSLL